MQNEIIALKKFGLAEKEAKAYLACLELGDCLASEISAKTSIPRTLVYDLLEKLIDLGLVSYSIKNNVKYFLASDPNQLIHILGEKKEAVEGVLSSLEKLQKEKGLKKPKVAVYEGIEGMKTVMNDILRSGTTELLSYGSSRSSIDLIPVFITQWHKRRVKQKIGLRIIYNDSARTREKVKNLPKEFTKFKFMPFDVESPHATLIYANKISLQSWLKEPYAVVIENEEMTSNQKRYFEQLWRIAKN